MDSNGNAVIVWEQQNGPSIQIYMSEYRNDVWTHPSNLTTDAISISGQTAFNPFLAMDNNGNAIIVWNQDDGSAPQIYKSVYRNSLWTHPSNLATDALSVSGQESLFPRVAMSNTGSAVSVWQRDVANGSIYMSELR